MAQFTDKYAVLTGAAGGISKATALLMAQRGLKGAIIADLKKELAEKSAKEIQDQTGSICHGFAVDIANPKEIEALFKFAGEKFPTIHILLNGAGVCPTTPIEELDADKWDWCMNINLRGAHLCVREAIKFMKPQKYGKIVNIASVAARIGGIASAVSYAASKGGLVTATKCYAKVLGKFNINVNAVCPGVIKTAMTANTDYSGTIATIPLGRLGETDDVSEVIAFLASDESKYITGCGIDVNGGSFMF